MTTLDPQIQPVGKPTHFEITPSLGKYHAEGWYGTYTITGVVTLAVETPGTHSISIEIDGAVAGDISFQAFQTADDR